MLRRFVAGGADALGAKRASPIDSAAKAVQASILADAKNVTEHAQK